MESSPPAPSPFIPDRAGVPSWLGPALVGLVLVIFYAVLGEFGPHRNLSSIQWLVGAWNPENNYEHGFLFPIIIVGLITWQWKRLRQEVTPPELRSPWVNWLAWACIFFGALIFVASFRTLQPRLAIWALPFLLWGCSLWYWGWQTARLLWFPFFFMMLAVPVSSFQQKTTDLQILATKLAQHGSAIFGVQTISDGTKLYSASGRWEPLKIDEGCGGIRSLTALLMISATWAYVSKISLWKKVTLFVAAFPLAIIGNTFRLVSIFVISEYGSSKFAGGTWHDWSGLLFFYPFSLILLFLTHALLEGGLPWGTSARRARRVLTRRQVDAK